MGMGKGKCLRQRTGNTFKCPVTRSRLVDESHLSVGRQAAKVPLLHPNSIPSGRMSTSLAHFSIGD